MQKTYDIEEDFAKWKATGLLEGLDEYRGHHVARLLESQRQMNASGITKAEYKDEYRKKLFERLSYPLIRRVYGNMLLWDLISVQSMAGPGSSHSYRDKYGNLKNQDIATKTRNLASYFPLVKAPTGLEELETPDGALLLTEWLMGDGEKSWYAEGEFASRLAEYKSEAQLDNEFSLLDHISNEIVNELTREVLTDLRNNAISVEKEWKNPANLADSIFYQCESITRRIGRPANWIVTSPQMTIELVRSGEFNPLEGVAGSAKKIQHVGSLGKIKVYVDPRFPTQEVLLGYKGDQYSSSYFYCPYIPFMERLAAPDLERYRLYTRYGKRLMSSDYYARIVVQDYLFSSAEEA